MPVNIVWFKRDIRLTDHPPLAYAIDYGIPVLLIYFIEPSLLNAKQSDVRHWRFVYQSIAAINQQLSAYNSKVHLVHSEVIPFFKKIHHNHKINAIFSHQETGIDITYQRDRSVKSFCKNNDIAFRETSYGGVRRGDRFRNNWPKYYYQKMGEDIIDPDLNQLIPCQIELDENDLVIPEEIKIQDPNFQIGGEQRANALLKSFLNERVSNYNQHISKPHLSRKSCSRLSAHLAWGNLSMRQVYQAMKEVKKDSPYKWNLNAFSSRLRWHCHFIQKFEMEPRMEFEPVNKEYSRIRTEWDEEKYLAWEEARTGYPMVDACMRCVKATGYLNFRMRSMLVSFLTHHLWLDWRRGADFLARQFLDFEPGIHYAQFQMQAGVTGHNTIRIYNPVKQAKDNDADGLFVRAWLPELQNVPKQLITEPWEMTAQEQIMYNCKIGHDYPNRIVDIKETYRHANAQLWKMKKDKAVKEEAKKILARHTG